MSKKIQNAVNLYIESIRDGKAAEAVEKHTGAVYKHHQQQAQQVA